MSKTYHALLLRQVDQVHASHNTFLPQTPTSHHPLEKEAWAFAVIKGADDSSPRWKHLCVLAGLLVGFAGQAQVSISLSLRRSLEASIVTAANIAMRDRETKSEFAANSLAVLLSHVFDLLSDGKRSDFDHGLLLPIVVHTSLFSKDGLHSGYFLSTMDADIIQVTHSRFDWSNKSTTYVQCQRLASGPVMTCLGPLSRLAALSIDKVADMDTLTSLMKDLLSFSRSLHVQWRQNKLCEIDAAEEGEFLTENTLRQTLPLLWRSLKSAVFSILVLMRAILGRVLSDRGLPADLAPSFALQSLHILKNLHFISSRGTRGSFSQYEFARLTAVDILSQFPVQAEAFLKDIRPSHAGKMSGHPLDRCQDFFFLNTAEQLALILPVDVAEMLLIPAATAYLGLASDDRLLQIFEAAHSVMLAVFSVPGNNMLLARHVHPYLDILFNVFPKPVSARQFRMAIKTLVRVTSQPSSLVSNDSFLPSIIMELVRSRLEVAATTLLENDLRDQSSALQPQLLSEQSACELALIDSLPLLPVNQLEGWLTVVAESLSLVKEPPQADICQQRFWEILNDGEMDVDRAALCLAWWTTEGGCGLVMGESLPEQERAMMSGALVEDSKL
ncbi:uncharacterized protein KY384_003106 [Bacidia gigantensis]|uniref:uncharacterized protein n=1 Tax=Bacidia gigantensis TaxID=2732470 RepID=UPI001D0401A3|nr:uncharacterized protein KY384_003106 [Bacidia gigantensis]KAG8531477.1 hypothetical protein KY384_003106 [Bacidia gigantensis]